MHLKIAKNPTKQAKKQTQETLPLSAFYKREKYEPRSKPRKQNITWMASRLCTCASAVLSHTTQKCHP